MFKTIKNRPRYLAEAVRCAGVTFASLLEMASMIESSEGLGAGRVDFGEGEDVYRVSMIVV